MVTLDDLCALIARAADGDVDAATRMQELAPTVLRGCAQEPTIRAALIETAPCLMRMAAQHDWAHWLGVCLQVLDDEPIVVIEPDMGLGVIGTASGLADNFQLHMLLMDAFPARRSRLSRRTRRISAQAAAVARGEGPQQIDEIIVGQWNLHSFLGFRTGQLPGGFDEPARATWIWSEGTLADVPVLDGHRVILLGPPTYERTWTAARTFADLPARLDVTALAPAEIDRWLERCKNVAGHPGAGS